MGQNVKTPTENRPEGVQTAHFCRYIEKKLFHFRKRQRFWEDIAAPVPKPSSFFKNIVFLCFIVRVEVVQFMDFGPILWGFCP